jgi:adenylylsulfate kinase-like enzyme
MLALGAAEICEFTGMDDPCERPERADLELGAGDLPLEAAVDLLVTRLERPIPYPPRSPRVLF